MIADTCPEVVRVSGLTVRNLAFRNGEPAPDNCPRTSGLPVRKGGEGAGGPLPPGQLPRHIELSAVRTLRFQALTESGSGHLSAANRGGGAASISTASQP
jgi:hypothetical protein